MINQLDIEQKLLDVVQLDKYVKEIADHLKKATFLTINYKDIDRWVASFFAGSENTLEVLLTRAFVVSQFKALDPERKFKELPEEKEFLKTTRTEEALKYVKQRGAYAIQQATDATKMKTKEIIYRDLNDGLGWRSIARNMQLEIKEEGELQRYWQRVCFPAGTIILTKEGRKPIEEIKVGDEVITHAHKFGKRVIELIPNKYSGKLITIKTKAGKTLQATPEHPIYIKQGDNYRWVPIKDLKKGDKVVSVKGYDTQYSKEWLSQKYFQEGLNIRQIAKEIGISPHLLGYQFKIHGLEIKNRGNTGRKFSQAHKDKISKKAKENNFADRLNTQQAQKKAKAKTRERYKDGSLICWNKGFTKDTHNSVKKISTSILTLNKPSWCKGLTKETSPTLKVAGLKVSAYMRTHPKEMEDRRQRQSATYSNSIATGKVKSYSYGKSGYIDNPFTRQKEFYRSSFEKIFAERCISKGDWFTLNHGIIIPYKNKQGVSRNYIPDILTETQLVETKSSWQIKHDHKDTLAKILAGYKYCSKSHLQYIVLTEKELFNEAYKQKPLRAG